MPYKNKRRYPAFFIGTCGFSYALHGPECVHAYSNISGDLLHTDDMNTAEHIFQTSFKQVSKQEFLKFMSDRQFIMKAAQHDMNVNPFSKPETQEAK